MRGPLLWRTHVNNKYIAALTAALVVASLAPASAGISPLRHGKGTAIKAGIVNQQGSIVAGTGYSVSHDGTGKYTLDVPAGFFKSCPALLVTPSGVDGHAPIPDDFDYITCGNGGEVKIQITIYSRTNGALQGNSFHFAMIDT
jgi:hypothetical protein